MSLKEEFRAFKETRKALVRTSNWDNWYFKLSVSAPMGFTVNPKLTAYDTMRTSVASGYGYAWIPTPPDKSIGSWIATCKRFERAGLIKNY